MRLVKILIILVTSLLIYRSACFTYSLIPKEQEIDHHEISVTWTMLDFVDNKDELAFIIGHEFGHIILRHTLSNEHKTEYEYHSDIVGVYLAHKAGYSLCGISSFWRRMGELNLSLYSGSHPNSFIRSYYLEMPECKGVEVKREKVTVKDAAEIFIKLLRQVEGDIRYRTKLIISNDEYPKASAQTIMRNKK